MNNNITNKSAIEYKKEGYEAADKIGPGAKCPYPIGTMEFNYWNDGFIKSAREQGPGFRRERVGNTSFQNGVSRALQDLSNKHPQLVKNEAWIQEDGANQYRLIVDGKTVHRGKSQAGCMQYAKEQGINKVQYSDKV